jgi:PAS domain S-box-containing protein
MDWQHSIDASFVIAAVFQLAAMVFAVKMTLEVRDRRPWILLFAAMAVMFVIRILRIIFKNEVIEAFSPYTATTVSLLLFISLFYIRKLSISERESENRYRALVELSPDAIFVNSHDRISYINPAAIKFFGAKSADQLLGRSPTDFTAPESVPVVGQQFARLIEGAADASPMEEQWVRIDGTRIDVEAVASSIPWYGGSAIQMVLRDITERKQAENERAKLLASERVARSNAEHANRMKDEFLATLSHELRTPLNAILGWSQLLREGASDTEELHQGLDTIERNARAQTQLIEDLLDMSRIISGKLRLDVQKVMPSAFIEAAIETIAPAATARGVRIERSLDPLAGPISGDPARLQQIVWNLLSNAVKFTPRDGTVRITCSRVESHVEIVVTDTGLGIDSEFLPFIFERFRQADASSTRRHGGLGLGLSIVKQLVDLHGGSVTASSPGLKQGASFRVQLPLVAVFAANETRERFAPSVGSVDGDIGTRADLSGLKVLVVDDEPDARELIRRVLSACGAAVTTAGSGALALSLMDSPDVLVSDIGMPDMDGYEFLRRVRALPTGSGKKVPAIALTAFARSEDRTRTLMAGYQVHISKPVSPSELIASVASVTGRTGEMAHSA